MCLGVALNTKMADECYDCKLDKLFKLYNELKVAYVVFCTVKAVKFEMSLFQCIYIRKRHRIVADEQILC